MSAPFGYWDSSALLPLCVAQPQTLRAMNLFGSYKIVTWLATEVEILSGLTRLERMGQLAKQDMDAGKILAEDLVRSWSSIEMSSELIFDACRLLERHPLRAADSLQLAAALKACEHKTDCYLFISADRRLAQAASLEGFAVKLI